MTHSQPDNQTTPDGGPVVEEVCVGVVQLDGVGVVADSVVIAFTVAKREATVVIEYSIVWFQLNRFTEIGDRVPRAAATAQ